jgi:hypothetical protein
VIKGDDEMDWNKSHYVNFIPSICKKSKQ